MTATYKFPEPCCEDLPCQRVIGGTSVNSRYCAGFPKQKVRRFVSSDPKHKIPTWCPKRHTPVCRIYGFATAADAMRDQARRNACDPRTSRYAHPMGRYTARMELSLGLNARDFWNAVEQDTAYVVLSDADIENGEVVEIDDGLLPYFFYFYLGSLIPVFSERSVSRERVEPEKACNPQLSLFDESTG